LPKVVCNSSPLIHLARIGKLELLGDFFEEVLIPEAVHRECVIDGKDRDDAKKIKRASWIKITKIKNIELKKALNTFLDEGESEAIILALQEAADFILLDDYEAREFARIYTLNITGTIGVLLKAKYAGRISSLGKTLEDLRETGFWLNENLYSKILQDAGEK
jgi:predicted nucleic acid-binding protein